MTKNNSDSPLPIDASDLWFSLLNGLLAHKTLVKLVLGKYVGDEPDLDRVIVKQIELREQDSLSFVYRYKTKDITKNFPRADGIATLRQLIGRVFKNAHLLSIDEELQLSFDKHGASALRRSKIKASINDKSASNQLKPAQSNLHDRVKQRYLDVSLPFLNALGITDPQGRVVPSMSAKWKQINKFIEIFSAAIAASPLANRRAIKVVDFGSGKGYLTFAVHDYLRHSLQVSASVTGIELREELVKLCNDVATKTKALELKFAQGEVQSHSTTAIDVLIALHACDVATDYAIHLGIRAGAAVIMCSPCCHKQIRPQIKSPELLRPILQHGVHLGEEAEMVTDSMRALLLEACGYEAKVFEFISLEHTDKNKMILAVKRGHADNKAKNRAENKTAPLMQLSNLKKFYGIHEQCLETLLQKDGMLV